MGSATAFSSWTGRNWAHQEWDDLGINRYESVAGAKNAAERIYPGSSGRWIDAHVSETEALKFRDAMLDDRRGSFCGKTPYDINQLIERHNVRICDSCIVEFHRIVREHSQSEE